ncbi:MAG: sodium:alanine symporter family protein [Chitinispirillaceae bacterium]|nr:sodium:alanine symporter family protein [Chitinispirillaceae bacterium]
MEQIESILMKVNDLVWGPVMLMLLLGTHIFLTFRLGWIQRFVFKGIRLSVERKKDGGGDGDISQFGALMTALAATIGTGNIVGVATAIAAGGPGAVFWMWITGVFGIATKYSEALLSVKYRITTKSGQMAGGPMYVLERGVKCRWLGILFALFTAIAAFGIGNTVQSNSISHMLNESYSVPMWITGIILTILTALVILGGIKSIARTCEKFVPVMSIIYILGCIILLCMHYQDIIPAIVKIMTGAFSGQAAVGGFLGAGMKQAMLYGVKRGLFSNESGMGSAPIVAAAAQTKDPVRQALVSSTGTFWDTVVICAVTGVTIVASGAWTHGLNGAALTKGAFSGLSLFGPAMLTFGLLTFVFSTILGWSYYGEKAAEYLFGHKVLLPYRLLWIAAVMIGAVVNVPIVWSFADITNALMAIPNLISLILLSGVIAAETRHYFSNEKKGEGIGNVSVKDAKVVETGNTSGA